MAARHSGIAGARRYFLLTGVAVGIAVSAWYLYRNHQIAVHPWHGVLPDPVWTRFVNVGLIMFASVFQFSVLHKLVLLVSGWRGKGRG